MRINVFSIFDDKGKAFMTPFFMSQIGQALRAFSDAVNDPLAENIYKHPEDFTLFHLGCFDVLSGQFDMLATPSALGIGVQYKRVRSDSTEVVKSNGKFGGSVSVDSELVHE